jgi:hypothetical protein
LRGFFRVDDIYFFSRVANLKIFLYRQSRKTPTTPANEAKIAIKPLQAKSWVPNYLKKKP